MEKVLICENTRALNEHFVKLQRQIPKLQCIVNEFIKCKTPVGTTEIGHVIHLFKQNGKVYDKKSAKAEYISTLLRQKIVDNMESPEINGVPIDKTKMLEMVSLPDISELVNEFDKYTYSNEFHSGDIDFNLYEIDNNVVKLKEDTSAIVTEMHRIYVYTPKGLTIFNQAKNIADNLNELEKIIHKDTLYKNGLQDNLNVLLRIDGKWCINPNVISNLDKLK